jgi:hypothetical protein
VSRRWHRRRDAVASPEVALQGFLQAIDTSETTTTEQICCGRDSAQLGFRILEGMLRLGRTCRIAANMLAPGRARSTTGRIAEGARPLLISTAGVAGPSPTRRRPRGSQSPWPVSGSALCRPREPCSADPAKYVVTPKARGRSAARCHDARLAMTGVVKAGTLHCSLGHTAVGRPHCAGSAASGRRAGEHEP